MKQFLHHKFQFPLIAISVVLFFFGVYSLNNLKTGLFPDITFPKIKVIADAGQQPIGKMMTTVTVPLENIIKRIDGLDYIRSTTSRGSCEISVFLKWSMDIDRAKQQIENLTNSIQQTLPPGVSITIEKMNPSILPVMGYSLEGNRSAVDLKKIAVYQIKPFLAASPGVSDVAIIGGKTKEYAIVLNPEKISALGLSFSSIEKSISESNILQSNGYIKDHNRLYLTLTDNAIDNLQELQDLVLQNTPSRLLRLKDVAQVEIHEAKEYIKINANGKDAPLVAVFKQPNANLIEVNDGVQKRVEELKKLLPNDIKLIPYYQQADFVNGSIKSIKDVLFIGIILAILVVILFLRSASSSIIVLITIPIILCLTLIVLLLIGYTINIMTLGAIAAAIGLVIDDTVIVIEQIYRNHEEKPSLSIPEIVNHSIKYLLPALVGSSLSTIVIFIPFSIMSGVAGAYFHVLAYTMIITLAASFFVTWIILPMLFLFIPIKMKVHKVKEAQNKSWISYFIHRPLISLIFVCVAILVLYFVPPRLTSGFLPEMDEGSIVLDFSSPPGTTLEETDRMLKGVDQILANQQEVEKFSRRLGTQMGFFITEPNRGDYLIELKKNRNKSTEEVSAEIRTKIESSIPQLIVDFGQVVGDMLGDLMSSIQPIEIKVFGDNQETIELYSKKVANELRKVDGTTDVFDGIVIAGPEINIKPNVEKLSQLGLTTVDFQYQLQTQTEGRKVGEILEKDQRVDIRLIYPNAYANSIRSLEEASILLPSGSMKPIKSVAKIKLTTGVAEINRENQKMIGVISARLNNRDLGSTLKDIKTRLANNIQLPVNYHIEYGGSYAQQQQAFKELLLILLMSSLFVFIVLLFLCRKIVISFVIIFISILGVSGSLLALYITHTPLNVGSYTGIIMIVGIIAENAIFTYWQYQEARLTSDSESSIVFSISTRLRPKLMTASAAIVALFPLALGIGTGAQMHQPLAIAVIGGLVVALPLLLIVLPTAIKKISR